MSRVIYFEKVDFLRAVAVFVVLLSHWIRDCGLNEIMSLREFGVYGVNLFFVISGFLITRNIIALFEKYNLKKSLKIFYIRRALRLFPALYLFLGLMLFLQVVFKFWVVDELNHLIYYALYVPNFLIYNIGWKYPSINNLWSLAVEEQFYFIWPFFIFIFRKHLKPAFIISILLGMVFIFLFDKSKLFPFGNMSYLAGGSLLSLYYKKKVSVSHLLLIIIGLISFLFVLDNTLVFDTVVALIFILILFIFLKDWKGNKLERFVLWKPFLYIGKISYGIYIYHRFIPYLFMTTLNKYSISMNKWLIFALLFLFVFIISHLSYQLYELKFLKLKERFK